MIKILHTADWHIGKKLFKKSLDEDIQLFFDWLINYINNEEVDVLIVAGDIFDMANPSHSSRRLYYSILKELVQTGVKVIITSGNHDSPTNLQASSDILKVLDIHVVGGVTDDVSQEVITFSKNGEDIVFAAVPFLRDKDLREGSQLNDPSNRVEQVRNGILDHYSSIRDYIQKSYPQCVSVGIGHLYLQSAKISDSERDIQIGNQAGISSKSLDGMFDYFALGHIHRPQAFNGGKISYSGSPIALSFSERADQKQVNLIEISSRDVKFTKVPLPKFRELIKLKGDFKTVKSKLESDLKVHAPLVSYVEIEIVENEYSTSLLQEINDYLVNYNHDQFIILKERIIFNKSPKSLSQQLGNIQINDLKPGEVFDRRLETEDFDTKSKEDIKDAFLQLLDKAYLSIED